MIYIERITAILLVIIFGFNLTQRKHLNGGEKKRSATLLLGIAMIIPFLFSFLIRVRNFPDTYIAAGFILPVILIFVQRKSLFIFKRKCPECGSSYSLKDVLYTDDAECKECGTVSVTFNPDSRKKNVEDIDWEKWSPTERAVLCFIRRDDEVLLIHKKTGHGKGLINGPGGRIEEGESEEEAAIRECKEEVGLTPSGLKCVGELKFQFADGYALQGTVFIAEEFSGEMCETDEADPFWCSINKIPYGEMWADDELWLPEVLTGKTISGQFIFDGEKMLSHRVKTDVLI